ncbi:DMT family transporter [Billgrantia kenyensis]|uniref:DMT family transporter n=1 Tax=Billgrantia kenyensis TaxID=321266 RepID=A0A7W0AGB6_9GAMM|nr:DMT family transporter [Halomonas kenyensis]MBA2781241.1 DMT family transporter [Halomonas kenyensis]MCG6663910.1 DMT family transporter [Halomonas kenyensis]
MNLPRAFLPVLLVVLWAGNWPASQLALTEIPPITFRLVTLWGGTIVMIVFCLMDKENLFAPMKEWPLLLLLAFLNVGLFNILSAFSIAVLEGGRAALIAFTMPVWVVFIQLLLGERYQLHQLIALTSGIFGITLIIYSIIIDPGFSAVASGLMAVAALSWATGSVMLARSHLSVNGKALTMWMLLISGLLTIFFLPIQSQPLFSFPVSLRGWLGLAYSTLIGMAVCQGLWFYLLTQIETSRAAIILLAIPPVGTLLSWCVLGAALNTLDALALLLLLISALLSARFGKQVKNHTSTLKPKKIQ